MRLRHPEQRVRNFIRMLPVVLLILSIPLAGLMLYEYFTEANPDVIRPLIACVFVIYFTFRSRFALQMTFVKDEEQ